MKITSRFVTIAVALIGLALLAGNISRPADARPARNMDTESMLAPNAACTPLPTPTLGPTPAFTPGPGCTQVPPPGVLTAVLTEQASTIEAQFTNNSSTCSYPIGAATYQEVSSNIEDDLLFDYQLAVIPPHSTLTLTIDKPTCDFHGWAFYGSLLTSFAGGQRYGERALAELPAAPTPTPIDTPTPTATPSVFYGCTAGFWKGHPQSYPAPYTPNTALGSVFTLPSCGGINSLASNTFSQTLNYRGGPDLLSAARTLLRQGVTGVLNARAGFDYPLSEAQVISEVNAALASCDRNTIGAESSRLETFNSLGCPLR